MNDRPITEDQRVKDMSEDRSTGGQRSWFDKITQAFAHEPKSREELLALLREASRNGLLDSDALSIVEGAIQVADLQARDIMVPRSQLISLKADMTLQEALPLIVEAAHSRYPVIGDSADEVLGLLLVKDLLPLLARDGQRDLTLRSLLRPAAFVPEFKRLNELLRDFRDNHNHMAIVVDEYGGVAGLVTIEDVLEQIVGDIEDEYDIDDDSWIRQLPNGDYLVKGSTPIDQFNELFDSHFSPEQSETVGQLVTRLFGHLPRRSESTEIGDFRLRVLNADSRRIHLLSLTRLDPQDSPKKA